MAEDHTNRLRRQWPMISWIMFLVTVAVLAGTIYLIVRWERADHRQNDWFDEMCTVHGGAYCEHKLPPGSEGP